MWQKILLKAGLFGIRWLRENLLFIFILSSFIVYLIITDLAEGGIVSGDSNGSSNQLAMVQQPEGINPWHFNWPTPYNYHISSPFGMRIDPFTKELDFHTGIDIPGNLGDPVQATKDGKVFRVEYESEGGGYGNVIYISHDINGDLVTTVYAHLEDIFVEVGDIVEQGHRIGTVGNTGRSTGPHLHYEIRIKEKLLDPFKFSYLYSLFSQKLVPIGEQLATDLVLDVEAGLEPNERIISSNTWFGIQTLGSNMKKVHFDKRVKAWGEFEIEVEIEEEDCELLEDGTESCVTYFRYEYYILRAESYQDFVMTFGKKEALFVQE